MKGAGTDTEFSGTWIGRQFHQGKVKKQFTQGDQIKLKDVIYVPNLRHNMYSLNQAIREGAEIYNKDEIYILKFPDYE